METATILCSILGLACFVLVFSGLGLNWFDMDSPTTIVLGAISLIFLFAALLCGTQVDTSTKTTGSFSYPNNEMQGDSNGCSD